MHNRYPPPPLLPQCYNRREHSQGFYFMIKNPLNSPRIALFLLKKLLADGLTALALCFIRSLGACFQPIGVLVISELYYNRYHTGYPTVITMSAHSASEYCLQCAYLYRNREQDEASTKEKLLNAKSISPFTYGF